MGKRQILSCHVAASLVAEKWAARAGAEYEQDVMITHCACASSSLEVEDKARQPNGMRSTLSKRPFAFVRSPLRFADEVTEWEIECFAINCPISERGEKSAWRLKAFLPLSHVVSSRQRRRLFLSLSLSTFYIALKVDVLIQVASFENFVLTKWLSLTYANQNYAV